MLVWFHYDVMLSIIQIVISFLLIIAILLQRNEAGLSGAFGGGGVESIERTRRGFEKFLFNSTIVLAVLFAASALLALFL